MLSNGDYVAVGTHQQVVSFNPTVRSAIRWKIFSGNSGGGFLDGNVNTGGVPVTLTMLRSNKILVGGSFGNSGGFAPALVRYNGNLTVDTTFGSNGRYDLGLWILDLRLIAPYSASSPDSYSRWRFGFGRRLRLSILPPISNRLFTL